MIFLLTFGQSGNIIFISVIWKGEKMETTVQVLSFILRLAEPFIAILITVMCFVSLKGSRRREEPLIVLEDEQNEIGYPVMYWENSIGRSRNSDICIQDMTVSRKSVCLLMRSITTQRITIHI